MNNYYAQRLYDLLRVWSGTKQIINYEVEELKELLQIEEKYNLYADFKRRVILPVIKELNDTGYFLIDIKENKVGRKVESIDFIVKDLDKRKYFTKDIEVIKNIQNPSVVEECAVTIDAVGTEPTTFGINESKKKVLSKDITGLKPSVSDFIVPDESLFTKGTLRSFKKDFKGIDFKNEYMERAFDDAVMITLDRDDVEIIKATSYKFFKSTLNNKVDEYRLEEQADLKHKKELDKYW